MIFCNLLVIIFNQQTIVRLHVSVPSESIKSLTESLYAVQIQSNSSSSQANTGVDVNSLSPAQWETFMSTIAANRNIPHLTIEPVEEIPTLSEPVSKKMLK